MTEWTTFRPGGGLDLKATFDCGQAFRWRETRDEGGAAVFEGVVFGDFVRVRQEGGEVSFACELSAPSEFRPRLEEYLGLNHDLEAIRAELSADAPLAEIIPKYPGLRILCQEPWECLVSFICSANNNIKRISQNVEDIAAAFGERIETADGEPRYAFPSPSAVAAGGEAALRELRIGYKAKYVHQAAIMVAEGEVDLYALRSAPYETALETVTRFPGVADKVGNCVALFSLDKLESFPVDVHIHRAVWRNYPETREFVPSPRGDSKRKPSPAQVRSVRQWARERFGMNAGYANQYLFYEDLVNPCPDSA